MLFDIIDGEAYDKKANIVRHAVKAIVYDKNKLLVIHTNQGDYKLPGGGIEIDETAHEALKRELKEECGAKDVFIKEKIGRHAEKNWDKINKNAVFERVNEYYLCKLNAINMYSYDVLDEYEAKLEFKAVYVGLGEIINNNTKILQKNHYIFWQKRELQVFKILQQFQK